MKGCSACLAVFILCIASISAQAQSQVQTHSCKLKGDQYTCDRHGFQQVLKAVKSVSVNAPRLDPTSAKEMDTLAQKLGKTVRSGSDLTLVLARSGSSGIYYGPSDRELATIRAYYGSARKLLWIESYYGQPDTPWPIVVNRLTKQFQNDFRQ